MKRLGRWAFNFLAGSSLALCVAVVYSMRHPSATERFLLPYVGSGSPEGGPIPVLLALVALLTPWWLLLLMAAGFPCLWLLSRIFVAVESRRLKRLRLGVCTKCSYDLRASLDRCPECGTAASRLSTAKE